MPSVASGAVPGVPRPPNPLVELLEKNLEFVFPRLVSIAGRVCLGCDPENVAAEAVLKAWKSRDSFDVRVNPWSLLYTITINTARDARRLAGNRAQSRLPIPPDLAASVDVEDEAASAEIAAKLQEAVQILTLEQMRVLHRLLYPTQGRTPEGFAAAREEVLRAIMVALKETLGEDASMAFLAKVLRLCKEGLFEKRV
jgi:DNA-directed RNA polymerase specialized sigma24 family protein